MLYHVGRNEIKTFYCLCFHLYSALYKEDPDVEAAALKINPAYFLFPRPLFRGNSDVDQLGKIFE